MTERLVSGNTREEDSPLDASLRPRKLADYVGQDKVKDNLRIAMTAAQQRGEPLDHLLLYGPPGLGKTTLANIIAAEMGVNIKVTSGPAIERPGDMAAILTNLRPQDILFVDEIHRLNKTIEEVLTDERLYNALLIEGRKQAEKFDWSRTARETLDVLTGV